MPSLTPFNPSATLADELIALLADPAPTLNDIAARAHTSTEALALWLARPDVIERIEALHSLFAYRTRVLAASLIPKSLKALTDLLDDHTRESAADAAAPPAERRPPELRQRSRESARRAATRILQLATFNPPRFSAPQHAPQDQQGLARAAQRGAPPVTSTEDRTPPAPSSSRLPNAPSPSLPDLKLKTPPSPTSAPAPTPIPTPPPSPALSPFSNPDRPTRSRSPLPSRSPTRLLQSVGAAHEHWP